MSTSEADRPCKVWYSCHDCGARFFLMQGTPEPDEDVCLCWDCIDRLFSEPGR